MTGVMGRENVDIENLEITGNSPRVGPDAPVTIHDDVIIVVNQAYGPDGDNLVGISDVEFDGFGAVTLLVRAGDREELVHLSPIHGDSRKQGMEGLADGTKCELLCPVSNKPLPVSGWVGADGIEYSAIYLTPKLEAGSSIFVSSTWGHRRSAIVDDHELISQWLSAETAASSPQS